jgi:molybdopterin-guanine dinucleotide biosynthesis protein A
VPVYILAGGRSRRFGSDKARSPVDGVPLILRIADSVGPVAESVTVVAREPAAYADLGLRTIGDVIKGKGPLGGLLTAIDDHGDDGWIFVTACDWLDVRLEWIRLLMDKRGEGTQAVVFRSDRYEPLFGLYHTSIKDVVSQRVDRGLLSLQKLFPQIATVTIPAPFTRADVTNLNKPIKNPAPRNE